MRDRPEIVLVHHLIGVLPHGLAQLVQHEVGVLAGLRQRVRTHAHEQRLERFRAQGGGSFVHLGSAGHDWFPKLDGLSVVPKAANEALIKGIAKEEGEHNIRANSVLVGVIDAGMFHELSEQGVFGEEWIAETHKLLCLRRWGQPEDIGAAADGGQVLRARVGDGDGGVGVL